MAIVLIRGGLPQVRLLQARETVSLLLLGPVLFALKYIAAIECVEFILLLVKNEDQRCILKK